MRVSTNSFYDFGAGAMAQGQSNLAQLQQQISTMKRVNNPSDDPIASAQILQLNQSEGRNSQFVTNTKAVDSSLSTSSQTLQSVSDLMEQLKTLAVSAGNAILTTTDLQHIQTQANQMFQTLVGYGNTRDGQGNYLFAGNAISKTPFVFNGATGVTTYQGDTGQRDVQVSPSSQISVTEVGSLVFGNGTQPTKAFDDVQQFISLLGQNPQPANFSSQLSNIISSFDDDQQRVLTADASIGARQNQNDAMSANGSDLDLQYQTALSKLQDLDMAKASSDLLMAQSSLQYSQLVFQKVQGLSLFNKM
ncbi:flagellar hook-associated protein FlgL [Crenobacter sp. SG2303]|uniref:Flagellar hook-associated protein FlgL n=1 Tax=Crenobacter oryzisoli TaxID=3056844 RepID=A0ABT7XKG0_9NEIS|nr:flagellar hook-associated protein FlgL [Crenobacter sp. SG2303]MDN0074263.1 flagellar hook-associated protein FlgL [Crenobacter sp. SG2303]